MTDDQAVPVPPDGIARTPAQIASDVYRCGGTWQQVLDAAAGPTLAEVAEQARAQGAATERERIRQLAVEKRAAYGARHYPFADLIEPPPHDHAADLDADTCPVCWPEPQGRAVRAVTETLLNCRADKPCAHCAKAVADLLDGTP